MGELFREHNCVLILIAILHLESVHKRNVEIANASRD